MLGSWGTQVHDDLRPEPGESIVVKHRVSPFYGTNLDLLLRKRSVDTLLLAGVSTDLVVLSAAREAHDRDYRVEVLEDATAARSKRTARRGDDPDRPHRGGHHRGEGARRARLTACRPPAWLS